MQLSLAVVLGISGCALAQPTTPPPWKPIPRKLTWAGPAAGFNMDDAWAGENPLGGTPKFVTFGGDRTRTETLEVPIPAGKVYNVGSKIVFNGPTKLVLGKGGSGGKVKLTFNTKNDGEKAQYLPGSGQRGKDMEGSGFDFKCHMNWRNGATDAKEGAYPTTPFPPCEGDTAYIGINPAAGRSGPPTAGDGSYRDDRDSIFVSTFGRDVYSKLFVEAADKPGNYYNNVVSDCNEDGNIIEGPIMVELGVCGDRNDEKSTSVTTFLATSFRNTAAKNACASTCPPKCILPDDSAEQAPRGYVQLAPGTDEDDGKYWHIDEFGLNTDGNVKVTTGQGRKLEVTISKDGEDHVYHCDVYSGKSTYLTDPPTKSPTSAPTKEPTQEPTKEPTKEPSKSPSKEPTEEPTKKPTEEPTKEPTEQPSSVSTKATDTQESGDKKKDSGNNTTIIIIIVVVIIVIVLAVVIVVVMMKKQGGGSAPADRSVVSFENPMYDDAGKIQKVAGKANPSYAEPPAQATGGYQDVGPASTGGGYMDVNPSYQPGAPSSGGNPGYMDVAPNAPAGTGGYMDVNPQPNGGGYMDVAGGDAQTYDDEDEEDV